MGRKSKTPQFAADMDPFADPAAPTAKRRGRPSNLERGLNPVSRGTKGTGKTRKPINKKKSEINSNIGTTPAYIGTNNLLGMVSKDLKEDTLESIDELVKGLEDKEKLTIQELKFIEYHLVRGFTVQKAMILAGYQANSEGMYHYHAKRIVRKYEQGEEDRRKIQRALGYGEVFVIQEMAKLARGAISELAKAKAIAALGAWLGMDKEEFKGSQGVTVIIKGYEGAQQQVNVMPQGRPLEIAPNHPQPSTPGGTVTITK